jgi:hypothetical protein
MLATSTRLGNMRSSEFDRVRSSSLNRERLLPAMAAAACVIVCACSTTTSSPYSDDPSSLSSLPQVEDRRGRFREIFCVILGERETELPDVRPCEEALTSIGIEPEGTGQGVDLGQSRRRLVAALVPGIGWECFSAWLDMKATAVADVRQFGYDLVALQVDALSSSTTNARQIRDAVMAVETRDTEPDLVLVGYSKGAPDILEAVVSYPEIRPRIAAVVSVAGAIGGSPVAEEVTQSKLELLRHWPGAECSSGDGAGIESLRPATRKAWLDENPLPREIPYYSLATCPHPERISSVLKPSYKKLGEVDLHNDGMVLFRDQLIPGSTFMGCVNADHWAVAVPIARSHPTIGRTVVDENDYPREALLEAVLRFVEEDLTTD